MGLCVCVCVFVLMPKNVCENVKEVFENTSMMQIDVGELGLPAAVCFCEICEP